MAAVSFIVKGAPTSRYPTGVEIDRNLALQSVTIKNLVEDMPSVNEYELVNATGEPASNDVVALIFTYLDNHNKNVTSEPEVKPSDSKMQPWEEDFFRDVALPDLFNFILLANSLDIKPALNAGCKQVANMIKGKTPEEIRKTFQIPSS